MAFKILLGVPIINEEEGERDSIELACLFDDEEQYQSMTDDNFDAICHLLYDVVQNKKGKEWEPDLGDPIEPVEYLELDSEIDLDARGI